MCDVFPATPDSVVPRTTRSQWMKLTSKNQTNTESRRKVTHSMAPDHSGKKPAEETNAGCKPSDRTCKPKKRRKLHHKIVKIVCEAEKGDQDMTAVTLIESTDGVERGGGEADGQERAGSLRVSGCPKKGTSAHSGNSRTPVMSESSVDSATETLDSSTAHVQAESLEFCVSTAPCTTSVLQDAAKTQNLGIFEAGDSHQPEEPVMTDTCDLIPGEQSKAHLRLMAGDTTMPLTQRNGLCQHMDTPEPCATLIMGSDSDTSVAAVPECHGPTHVVDRVELGDSAIATGGR